MSELARLTPDPTLTDEELVEMEKTGIGQRMAWSQRCGFCGCIQSDGDDDCPGVIFSDSADRCLCHAGMGFSA